jgi:hypothetical protein
MKFQLSLNFNAISYVGRLWCPELIPDIEKFLPVTIFKMATTIPHKFNIDWPLTTSLKNKSKAAFEIEQCWIFAVLWWLFWKWRPVETFWCRESIQDVEIKQCGICAALRIDSWHRKISTGHHFQNGHHNTAQSQHCPKFGTSLCQILCLYHYLFRSYQH